MRYRFLSETFPWVSGGTKTLPLEFLDRAGPKGGRMVIEEIIIEAALNITTGAGVSMAGPDQASFVRQLFMRDNSGERRRLTGFELRQHAAYESKALADPATHAASTTQTDTYRHVVPFRFEYARRSYDYTIPVDDIIQGGILQILMPANSDLIATGGTPTINSGSYVCVFYLREEFDVEAKVRDRVIGIPSQGSDNFIYVPIGGDLVRSLFLTKEQASTAAQLFTLTTDVTVDNVKGYTRIPRAFLQQEYLQDRPTFMTGFTTAMDPIFNSLALPIFNVGKDVKVPDLLRFGGQLIERISGTNTGVKNILHSIATKEERIIASTNMLNGLPPDTAYEMKLDGAGKGDVRVPKNWGPLAAYMATKARRTYQS